VHRLDQILDGDLEEFTEAIQAEDRRLSLEAAGVWSATVRDFQGDLVLHSDAVSITMPEAALALAAFSAVLIAISGYLASRLAQAHRSAVRKLELQAWHLRQLVGS